MMKYMAPFVILFIAKGNPHETTNLNLLIDSEFIAHQSRCISALASNGTIFKAQRSDVFSIYKAVKEIVYSSPKNVIISTPCSYKLFLENIFKAFDFFLVLEWKFVQSDQRLCCLRFGKIVHNTSSTSVAKEIGWHSRPYQTNWPREFFYEHVLFDITNLLGWKNVCILYAENKILQTNTVLNVLSEAGVKVWLQAIRSGQTIETKLSQCYFSMVSTGINFILIADQPEIENMLTKVNSLSWRYGRLAQLGLMSRWFILADDVCVKCLQAKVHNVSNVSLLLKHYTVQECNNCRENKINSMVHMTSQYKVVTAFWQRSGRQFGTVISWASPNNVTILDDVFPNVRMGLNNATLIVTTKDWDPFTIKTVVDGHAHYSGVCLDLIEEMSRRLNFSYVVVEPADNQWGLKMLSGNWTGMIAQLATREVDVMVAAASIQQEREEVMDFVHPFYNDYTSLLLKKPDKTLEKWKLLIAPLQWTVVVCILLSLPIVTLILTTMEKVHPCYDHIDRTNRRGLHRFDDCLWYNMAALLNEGGQECPMNQAGRTVVATWWLFTIVIVASYTSTLTAALTVEKDELPFDTIEQMIEQSDYKWGGTNGSYMFMLFQKSDNEIYKRLWDGVETFLEEDPNWLNTNHHVQTKRVKEGNYVLMNDKSVNLIEAAKDCNLAITKQEFLPLNFGIGLQQNSPYRHLFQEQMMSIEESGLLQMWKSKWWPPMHKCTKTGPTEVKAISIIDVQGGYLILGMGTIISLFTFAIENYVKKCSHSWKCSLCKG